MSAEGVSRAVAGHGEWEFEEKRTLEKGGSGADTVLAQCYEGRCILCMELLTIAFCNIWHFINMLREHVVAAEGLKWWFPGNCRALGGIQTEFCVSFWPRIQNNKL